MHIHMRKRGALKEYLDWIVRNLLLGLIVVTLLFLATSNVGQLQAYKKGFAVRNLAYTLQTAASMPGHFIINYSDADGYHYQIDEGVVNLFEAEEPTILKRFFYPYATNPSVLIEKSDILPVTEGKNENKTLFLMSKGERLEFDAQLPSQLKYNPLTFSCLPRSKNYKKLILNPYFDETNKGPLFSKGYAYQLTTKLAESIDAQSVKYNNNIGIVLTREKSPVSEEERQKIISANPDAFVISLVFSSDNNTILVQPTPDSQTFACHLLNEFSKEGIIFNALTFPDKTAKNRDALTLIINPSENVDLTAASIVDAAFAYERNT